MYPNYNNSILNVSATILKHYNAHSNYVSIPVLENELNKNYKHLVLVLLDGMGVNIVKEYLKPTDFLRKNMKQTVTSVFPPTTVAATNTVLSGLPPYVSGYLGWVQYFENEDTNNCVFLNEDYYDETRKLKENLRDKYLKYPTIYEQIRANSKDVETFELFPNFRENGYNSFQLQTNRILEIMAKKGRTFTYAYWTEPDLVQHTKGISSNDTKKELEILSECLSDLSKKMNNDSLLIVIADHGLIDVHGIDLFDNEKLLKMLKRMPSIEPRAATFFVKESKKKCFKELFLSSYGKHFKLMTKKEVYDSKLLGNGVKHSLLDSFIGDFTAISTSKYMFNFSRNSVSKAHHAGLTKAEMEVPLILFSKKKNEA